MSGRFPSPLDAPPGFEVLGVAGEGSTGVVWAARATATGTDVALKRVTAAGGTEVLRQVRREAEVLASLDHPNVLRLLDLLEVPGGDLVLVTELAPGGTLADLIAHRGRLPADEVVAVGTALAGALGAAHGAGVLHRDVKPANVLFGAGGQPLLADFGLAALAGRRARGLAVAGTAEYLDPAVAAGAPPDVRADLYALGVTLYEALSGHPPHTGDDADAVLAAAAAGRHAALEEVAPGAPAHVTAAVTTALAPDPRLRQPDAAAFADELRGSGGVGAGLGAALPWDAPARRPSPVTAAPAPAGDGDPLLPLTGGPAVPRRPTRTFGPRPPRPATAAQVLQRGAVLAPVVALVVTAGVLLSPLSPLAGDGGTTGETIPPTTTTSTTCRTIEPAPGLVEADLDGDGCATALAWDGEVLEVPPGAGVPAGRYAIGRPGDALLFGDWACDGVPTPAIHRPQTGEVIVFERWPQAGSPLEGRTTPGRPGGEAEVAREDGCDRIVITR